MSKSLLVFSRTCNQAIRVKKYLKLIIHEINVYNTTLEICAKSNKALAKFCETYPRRVLELNHSDSCDSVKFTACNGDFISFDDVLLQIVSIRHNDVEPKVQIGVETTPDLLVHREEVYRSIYGTEIEDEIF
jgi:sRNA-binding carbon storage regulator CsrA